MSEALRPNLDIDPRVLGQRLQEARKDRKLTQQGAAEALGMSRPTYIAIEKGERPVQPHELIRLAQLYGRSVHQLLRQRPPIRDFVPHFRGAAVEAYEGNPELDDATRLLQRLSDDYLELEGKCGSLLPRNYPGIYDISGRDPGEAAEEVASAERNRLGLGDGPVPNLRDLLEADVGLRIFYIALPARISGLFVFTEELGGCIAIQRKHPPGRRLWSLCHEYAHFLAHRYEPEVTILRTDVRRSRKARFADSFARTFLMPALGLRRRFYDLVRSCPEGARQLTPAALINLADLYGVSFEALLLRLEDLRLIPVGTWQRLKDSKFQVREAQSLLGLGSGPEEPMLPRRYMGLAVRAYEDGLLSEGELVETLHADRQQARRTVQEQTTRTAVTEEGEAGQLVLDLAEPLAGAAAPRAGLS
jgi:Zn-dependent peptidase ImmA (M78 family)/transcriptional regulator with XRE-family HTH domain